MEIYLPQSVKFIIDKIYERGYEAFIVGGCVRDSILGIEPNDYDITTNAKPDEIISIFKDYRLINNGIKHGTVGVIIDNDVYEITTYRLEGEYENNRRPKSVEFTSDITEDLKRRDFTINALAYNEKIGLIDEFNGIDDINNKIIKTVGDPDERFNEDGLRMIRAIRFSSKLNFDIERETLNSIYKNADIIKNISNERITEEFTKIVLSPKPENIILLYKTGIFKSIGIYLYINDDKYINFEEQLKVLYKCSDNLEERLAILEYIVRGIDSIECNNDEAIKSSSIVNSLKYSKRLVNECNTLVIYMHMDIDNINLVKIKLILNKIEVDNFKKVLNLKKLYYNECLKGKINNNELEKKNKIIDGIISSIIQIKKNNECYTIKDLDINGEDLKVLGYKGKDIGEKLNLLLDKVIKEPKLNKKEVLVNLL